MGVFSASEERNKETRGNSKATRLIPRDILVRLGRTPEATPWLWGINGIFGVISSGLSVMFSIGYGISATLVIAAIMYALLPIAVIGLAKGAR
jgi:hypothetical protein